MVCICLYPLIFKPFTGRVPLKSIMYTSNLLPCIMKKMALPAKPCVQLCVFFYHFLMEHTTFIKGEKNLCQVVEQLN